MNPIIERGPHLRGFQGCNRTADNVAHVGKAGGGGGVMVGNAGTCGQRRVDSKNSQTTPATTSTSSIRQLLGAADAQTAHHATFSTAPAHQILGSANAETTPAGAPAAAANAATPRNMRREERGTVQGPVKEQQPDGMSHRGVMVGNAGGNGGEWGGNGDLEGASVAPWCTGR